MVELTTKWRRESRVDAPTLRYTQNVTVVRRTASKQNWNKLCSFACHLCFLSVEVANDIVSFTRWNLQPLVAPHSGIE